MEDIKLKRTVNAFYEDTEIIVGSTFGKICSEFGFHPFLIEKIPPEISFVTTNDFFQINISMELYNSITCALKNIVTKENFNIENDKIKDIKRYVSELVSKALEERGKYEKLNKLYEKVLIDTNIELCVLMTEIIKKKISEQSKSVSNDV